MSVSGWETRSMASARGAGDHHQYQHQHHRHSLHGARQFDGGQPYPQNNNNYRPSDVPPRHYSFAQPPKQYEYPPQQPGRRTEMRQRRQSVTTGALPSRAELVRLQQQQQQQHHQQHYNQPMMWESERQQYPRERMSMPHAPSFRQEQAYNQQQQPRRESNARYTQEQRRDPPRHEQQYQRHSEYHYKQQPQRQYDPREQPQVGQYTEQQYNQHPHQQRDEQYDQYPPQRRPSLPQYQRQQQEHTPAPPIPEEPQVNLDDALLDKRWKVQIISYLYQFQRAELGDYANELVKFLRGHAVMSYEQEFGYSVIIRFNADCVVFQIVEARDLHAEFLVEKMEQPQRPETIELINPRELEERHRTGSIAVFFPRSAENPTADPVRRNAKNGLGPHRFSNGSRSNHNGSENSYSSSTGSHQYRRDAKFPFLVRGNEELMSWVTSWIRRRFQCSTGKYAVQVSAENLRRVARNWVIESLEREERVGKAILRNAERVRKASGLGGVGVGDELSLPAMDMRAPVLLKYRTARDTDAVKAFTVTMPWAAVRRYYAKMHGGVSSALGSVPEVLDRVEKEYFGHVAKDLAAMEFIGFQMEEVEVDTEGTVKFFKLTMIQSILQSYLDTLAVQLAPNAADGETTTF